MMSNIKNFVKNLILAKSKKINQPIMVFESDDWGSIRNSNAKNIASIKEKFSLKLDNYQSFDTLENDDDIINLKTVLFNNENKMGSYPKFTLNYVLHNPDFETTISNDYKTISLLDTVSVYKKNNNCSKVLSEVKTNLCFKPQFHGYIHFNEHKILEELHMHGDNICKYAFKKNCIGFSDDYYCGMDACNTFQDSQRIKNNLIRGLKEFETIFGFASNSICFPCYVWNDDLEELCRENGVKYLQGKVYQNIPIGKSKYKKKINIMGKCSNLYRIYLNRNIDFEPSKFFLQGASVDNCVSETMRQIDFVLKKKIPAVICSHRVNYVSGISLECRNYSLDCLDRLLKRINQKYPNLKYLFSDELGELYGNKILQKHQKIKENME